MTKGGLCEGSHLRCRFVMDPLLHTDTRVRDITPDLVLIRWKGQTADTFEFWNLRLLTVILLPSVRGIQFLIWKLEIAASLNF